MASKQWIEPQPVHVPEALAEAIGGHWLLVETLARRGIADLPAARAFLNPDFYTPAPAFDLPDMDKAVERLRRAVQEGETICVWGDFDVDGQTSTALLVSALREVGGRVVYYIPNRQTEGHGLHIDRLAALLDQGAHLLLTCDTGIAAHEAVDYATARGIDTIITDHHNLMPTLPAAHAVINPKRLPETHPLRELPGVGCAYKVIEALYGALGRGDKTGVLLDLVALGIVADVAVQTGDTRYLLQKGLRCLRQTERIGLKTMMAVAELEPAQLSEEHIAFVLAPRLNAVGRLDDANRVVELLTTSSLERARILAHELEAFNNQRKLLSEQVYQGAEAQIAKDVSLLDYGALVLANPHWHTGVVGIVASRLVERYRRPVVLLANRDDGLARGSARSVFGCDITAAIAAQRALLVGYGGHTMAAGLSLPNENIADFRRGLSRTVKQALGAVSPVPTLLVDGYVALHELSPDLVQDLERLAPFGPGNPPLTLATRSLRIKTQRVIGKTQEHVQFTVEDSSGTGQTVIWWQGADEAKPEGVFDLAYAVRASDYQGKRSVQMQWVDARVSEDEITTPRAEIEIVDYRTAPDARRLLDQLQTQTPPPIIWAEGQDLPGGVPRERLQRAETLVIWSAPPGPSELKAALDVVRPKRVVLFCVDPNTHTLEAFTRRLSGLAQYVFNHKDGHTSISALAGATAQRETTVRKGLIWLAARGAIHIMDESEHEDTLHLVKGGQTDPQKLEETSAALRALLAETSAYRHYYAQADPRLLIY